MEDLPLEWERDGYTISTDRRRLDVDRALALLRETPWAAKLDRATLARALAHSVCFGLYRGTTLVGLARVVTDLATFGYLTDVVITSEHRGQGLGRWLTECILAHPAFQGFRRIALLTLDAAGFYAQLGFREGPGQLTYMERDCEQR